MPKVKEQGLGRMGNRSQHSLQEWVSRVHWSARGNVRERLNGVLAALRAACLAAHAKEVLKQAAGTTAYCSGSYQNGKEGGGKVEVVRWEGRKAGRPRSLRGRLGIRKQKNTRNHERTIAAALLEAIKTVAVICLAFLRAGQDLIRLGDLLELYDSLSDTGRV